MATFNGLNSNASTLYSYFQGGTLILTTKSLGVPGTLLNDLTMKPAGGFESANPGLVIGKYLINSLLTSSNKTMYKTFKI